MYTKPLSTIKQWYEVKYHLCADDTQLYVSLNPGNKADVSSSVKNLDNCIADIQLWLTSNFLKLNEDKTNIIYMASPYYSKSLNTPDLQIGESWIYPTEVRKLESCLIK